MLIFETREAFFSNLEIQKWNLLKVTRFQIFNSFSTSLACPCLWPLLTRVVGTTWGYEYTLPDFSESCVPSCPAQHAAHAPWPTENSVSIISPKQISTMYKTLTVSFVFSVSTKLMTLRLWRIIYLDHFLLFESVFKESSLVMTTKLNLKSNCIYNVSNTKPPTTTNTDRVAA